MILYYINLARRTERRANMEQRFGALGLSCERIEAVTPGDISAADRGRYCNPGNYRWQSEGELACSLSHIKAMQRFLATDEAFAAIFEDDAILSPSLPGVLAEFEAAAPRIDILRLETDFGRLRMPKAAEAKLGAFDIYRLHAAGGGAAGYIISRAGAERVKSGSEALYNLTDQALFNPYAPISKSLTVRQLVPAVLHQEDRPGQAVDRLHSSDLERLRWDRGGVDRANFWRRAAYNFYDIVDRDIVGAIRNLWLYRVHGVAKRDIPFKTD